MAKGWLRFCGVGRYGGFFAGWTYDTMKVSNLIPVNWSRWRRVARWRGQCPLSRRCQVVVGREWADVGRMEPHAGLKKGDLLHNGWKSSRIAVGARVTLPS